MIIIFLLFTIMLLMTLAFNNRFVDTFTNKGINVVLIGDSMLNNSAYVSANESIPDMLSKDLAGNTVYNFAKDEATINDCYTQLDKISTDLNTSNTFIVVSCGGNNILNDRKMGRDSKTFISNLFNEYSELLKSISTRASNASLHVLNLYTPVNSHYNSYHSSIDQWNQLLEENSSNLGYKIIKTNNLLVTNDDFTYNIEPSTKGGKKIVKEIIKSINN